MRRMVSVLVALSVLVAGSAAMAAVFVPMDQQITHPTKTTDQSPAGNAIYEPANFGDDSLSITPGVGTRLTQADSRPGTGGDGWYYMYLDLNLAGIGEVNVAGETLSFDARIYQEASNYTNANGDPVTRAAYADANIFVRIYTYAANGTTVEGYKDFGIVYGPNAGQFPFGDWYPTWSTVTINVDAAGTASGAFDPTRVSRIRWYGTDWNGNGSDFTEVRNVAITPEPVSALLLGLGGLLLRRRRA